MKRRQLVLLLASVMASERASRAQQKAMPVVGFLGNLSPALAASFVAAFKDGLTTTGFIEGQSVAIEYHWAEGHYDRLPAFAFDFVARKVDVIIAAGTPGIAAAKNATRTIPIVFTGGGDLVAGGLVASLAHPGGNLTGISIFGRELHPKRFQLLCELVPQAALIALLVNPAGYSGSDVAMRDLQDAARMNGRQLTIAKARTEPEIDAAFATFAQHHVGALFVPSDPYFTGRREQLVDLAARYAIPAIYDWREYADAGGLMSYGPSLDETFRQAGIYAGRVLAGAKPAELPIQQPARFELLINLKTARALGLTIPQSILARADEVIE
jgi:putative tryptophan/tyrosine transport system substrate-binding protein